jgi:hypothetical protein
MLVLISKHRAVQVPWGGTRTQLRSRRCLEIGMDGYVAKPIRSAELVRTIEAEVEKG